MKHQGYYTRALKARDPRFARVFEKMGYGTTALQAASPIPILDINALRVDYEKAFGRKPFNGWSAEVLSAKIAEKRADA